MQKTQTPKKSEIKRGWHLVDAKSESFGRLAAGIAGWLQGKNKVYYTPALDCGDYVVVVNAAHLKYTGNKLEQKVYTRYSGYPGGLKKTTLKEQLLKKPELVIKKAVAGMLPKNKLRDRRLARLKVFKDERHPYGDKFK
ncbi:MAG: 50S ribosomal protein L13 [Candidatus Shapirobacteria bacterium]